MWYIRFKETKAPFVITRRIGYTGPGPGGHREPEQGRPIRRHGAGPDTALTARGVIRKTNRKGARQRDMPHGCKRIRTLAEKQAGMLPGHKVCRMCGKCGKYYIGYSDEAHFKTAVVTSGILYAEGISYPSLEFINECGKTMAEMVSFPVEKGFALRHKKELWYWINPTTKRVWYRRPSDTEGAWRKAETEAARQEGRDPRRNFKQQSFIMICGMASGDTNELPFYE